MSSLFFAGQGAEEADKILDLRVREIEAEGGHPRLSDRRASLLDDVEEVLVRERLRATGGAGGCGGGGGGGPEADKDQEVGDDPAGGRQDDEPAGWHGRNYPLTPPS